MKITVYTIKDCAFSKQEKEYLNINKLTYEEKNLETNKDFLTEMLAVSNNFAGTPVTRVEKDDGSIAVLKGFTKEEFDTTFGFTPTPVADTPVQPKTDSTVPSVGSFSSAPIPAPIETPPIQPTPTNSTVPPAPVPTTDAPVPPKTDSTDLTDSTVTPDPLKSVIDDLQAKAQPITESPPTVPPADAPSIPDFPAK